MVALNKTVILNIVLLLCLLFINSCNLSDLDELEDSEIAITNPVLLPLEFKLNFIDATTKSKLENIVITINFKGQGDENGIVDSKGTKWSDYQTSTGQLILYYDPNFSPTTDDPIEFTAVATSRIYNFKTEAIRFTKTTNFEFTIEGVKN